MHGYTTLYKSQVCSDLNQWLINNWYGGNLQKYRNNKKNVKCTMISQVFIVAFSHLFIVFTFLLVWVKVFGKSRNNDDAHSRYRYLDSPIFPIFYPFDTR